jgi:hypothetical protein
MAQVMQLFYAVNAKAEFIQAPEQLTKKEYISAGSVND